MIGFLHDIGRYSFLQHAVLAGLLASVACGIVGAYVVVRRMTYLAGSIAHAVLGGMGIAKYLQVVHGMTWLSPLLGATIAAVLAALAVALAVLRGGQRTDTALSVVWAFGMAIGLTFLARTPGYHEELMSYLFGNILMVSRSDIAYMALLDLVVVAVTVLFYHRLLAIGFNEELARLRGIRVELYFVLFLILTALTVVLLVQVVGIVLVIALMTLPAASAGRFVGRLAPMMVLAVLLSALSTVGGLALSYGPELPASATIIEFAVVLYLIAFVVTSIRRRRA